MSELCPDGLKDICNIVESDSRPLGERNSFECWKD